VDSLDPTHHSWCISAKGSYILVTCVLSCIMFDFLISSCSATMRLRYHQRTQLSDKKSRTTLFLSSSSFAAIFTSLPSPSPTNFTYSLAIALPRNCLVAFPRRLQGVDECDPLNVDPGGCSGIVCPAVVVELASPTTN